MTIEVTNEMVEAAVGAMKEHDDKPHQVALREGLVAVFALVERDYRLTEQRHIITFNQYGWTLMHPVRCRPNLNACVANIAAHGFPETPPAGWGAYEVEEPDPTNWATMRLGAKV